MITPVIPAKNIKSFNFKTFIIRKGSQTIFTFNSYDEALTKYEEIRDTYQGQSEYTLEGGNKSGFFTIHYIFENKIKDYSFYNL